MTSRTGLRVLVVDDEEPARGELAFLLRNVPDVSEAMEAADAAQCLSQIEHSHPDAVFLDVRMPHLDGLDLARIVKRAEPPPLIVFVTAFDQYAVDAFGLAAVDYLLKPVRPERLLVTVQRLVEARRQGQGGERGARAGDASMDERLAVLRGQRIVLVDVDDIRLASVEDEHVVVRTTQGRFLARQTMSELEDRLRQQRFMRVHRQHLVNLHHIVSIEPFFNGAYMLKVRDIGEVSVPVSRRHAAALRAAIGL